MYYVVEVISSRRQLTIGQGQTMEEAETMARKWSSRSGSAIEIQNEMGRCVRRIQMWNDFDY